MNKPKSFISILSFISIALIQYYIEPNNELSISGSFITHISSEWDRIL